MHLYYQYIKIKTSKLCMCILCASIIDAQVKIENGCMAG